MNMQEHLESLARIYWEEDIPLPLDLFYKMVGEGLDVEQLEKQFKKEHENG